MYVASFWSEVKNSQMQRKIWNFSQRCVKNRRCKSSRVTSALRHSCAICQPRVTMSFWSLLKFICKRNNNLASESIDLYSTSLWPSTRLQLKVSFSVSMCRENGDQDRVELHIEVRVRIILCYWIMFSIPDWTCVVFVDCFLSSPTVFQNHNKLHSQ